jgi:hypothetical protein
MLLRHCKKIFFLTCLLLSAILPAALLNRNMTLQFQDGAEFLFSFEKEQFPGSLQLFDGKNKQYRKLHGKAGNEQLVLQDDTIAWTIQASTRKHFFHLEAEIVNKTDRELWLEPEISLTCRKGDADQYWGGFDLFPAAEKKIERLGKKGQMSKHIGGGLTMPFPVSALLQPQKAIILAQQAFAPVSYSSAIYTPVTAEKAQISYSMRIVVPPLKAQKFHFALGAVPRRFDAEETIVQAHYDSYPEEWRPVQGQDDPYIWGAHSHYLAWYYIPHREKERRRYATVDWAYTPYKRAGDPYGRKQFWDYTPAFPIKERGFGQVANLIFFDYRKMSIEDFHQTRKKIFDKHGRDFGYAFYANAAWCEIALAEEHYPDAINNVTEGSIVSILGPWSTHHDREIRVFPMGTSFAKQFKTDLKQLYEELNLPGFAIDCGSFGIYYRGPACADETLPGRAWDEKGVFICESITINELIDYIHSLNPENPPFAWKNGVAKSDYTMIETSIFNPIFRAWMPLTRYLIGQRPTVIHSPGYLFEQTIPQWQNLDQEAFMEEYAKLGDHVVLTDFQYGFTQSHEVQSGNPQSIYCMPELLTCIRNGWQALIPVETNHAGKYLYRARYGRDASTILYYGNPWPERMPLTFKVDNSALGEGYNFFVPMRRDFASLTNRIAENGDTVFQATLPSRRPALFEAVLNISQSSSSDFGEVLLQSRKDLHLVEYRVQLNNPAAFRCHLKPRWIHRFTPVILVNGKIIPVGEECILPPEAEVCILYHSQFFRCSYQEIDSFPFVDADNKPDFSIWLPPDANSSEMKEAVNLQTYFAYMGEVKVTGTAPVFVIKDDEAPEGPVVQIRVGRGGPPVIERKGQIISLNAGNVAEADAMMKLLNYAMDRQFPYFCGCSGPKDMADRFNLRVNLMPYERCFESTEFAQ